MSDAEVIQKALERLSNTEVEVHPVTRGDDPHDGAFIDSSLARLIRKAAKPFQYLLQQENVVLEVCRICNTRNNTHTPDCALIALCRAIAGEGA